jgi:DNA-binding PadR family transcriptional regulator
VDLAFLSRRYHSILAAFGATLDAPQGNELQAVEITNFLQDKDKGVTGLSLGPALSWLKRSGLLELVLTPIRRWRLTPQGSAVAISLPPPSSTLTLRSALLSLFCQRASATTSELLATLDPSQIPGVLNIRSVSATLRSLEKDNLVRGDHPSSIERENGSVSVWSITPQGKRALQENKADETPAPSLAPAPTNADTEISPSFQKKLLLALDHLREILEKQTELLAQAVGSSSQGGAVRFDITPPRRGEDALGIRPSFVEDYPSSSF